MMTPKPETAKTIIEVSAARHEMTPANDPAILYLATLGSPESRRVVLSRMNGVASMLQLTDWRSIPWQDMDRTWLLMAKEVMTTKANAPESINATLSMLKGVALQAWELHLISDNRYMRIKNTKNVRGSRLPKRRWLSVEEMRQLLDSCLADDRLQGLRDAAMIAMLYSCGLRRSEVIGIDISHIQTPERAVRILGKGNKERMVYPPDRAWQMLDEWINEAMITAGPLFLRIRKSNGLTPDRLTSQAVYYVIKRLILLSGLDSFSPHDLRGSFISYLLNNGEDIKTVADIVGHSDIRTTAGYDRRGEARKKKANRSVEL